MERTGPHCSEPRYGMLSNCTPNASFAATRSFMCRCRIMVERKALKRFEL